MTRRSISLQQIINLRATDKSYYYTSHSPWKIWLVETIQSILNSLWTWHDKCNICCIYHVKFNVCLVTKPLGVFSSETKWLNALLLFLRMKCIIKQLLNSVFAWYHELSKPSVCVSCRSFPLRQMTDLGFDNSWYHAQPHPIIVYYCIYHDEPQRFTRHA